MGNKKNGFTRRYCSIPDIGNIRHWFEKNFHNACEYHDNLYAEKFVSRKKADKFLAMHMQSAVTKKNALSKVFIYYPIIGLTYISVRLFGGRRYDG